MNSMLRLAARWWMLVAISVAGPGSVHAEDWRETLTLRPGTFPALRPLTARYDIRWSGLKAAEAEAQFSRPKGGKLQLNVQGRSVGAARALWRMDSTATSTCNAATLRPITLQQKETYSAKTLATTVTYTTKGSETLRVPIPPDPTPPKIKRFKFAPLYDLPSALLFIRSQPLKAGQTTRICIFPGSSPYLAEATVTGREKIKTAGREWPAIRCDLRLQSIDKDFTLKPHKAFKKATAWISDDADRLLLRVEAEIMVGKVRLELDEVTFAK